jgi:hypothetical protein
MRKTIISILVALLFLTASSVEAQVRVHFPRKVDVRVGDPPPRKLYNRYNVNRGFWIDAKGNARWNNAYYTGWRGDIYYSNGHRTRMRNGKEIIWIR